MHDECFNPAHFHSVISIVGLDVKLWRFIYSTADCMTDECGRENIWRLIPFTQLPDLHRFPNCVDERVILTEIEKCGRKFNASLFYISANEANPIDTPQ